MALQRVIYGEPSRIRTFEMILNMKDVRYFKGAMPDGTPCVFWGYFNVMPRMKINWDELTRIAGQLDLLWWHRFDGNKISIREDEDNG